MRRGGGTLRKKFSQHHSNISTLGVISPFLMAPYLSFSESAVASYEINERLFKTSDQINETSEQKLPTRLVEQKVVGMKFGVYQVCQNTTISMLSKKDSELSGCKFKVDMRQ